MNDGSIIVSAPQAAAPAPQARPPSVGTLRLVDRVGAAPATETARPGVEGLTVPEWGVLYPPHGTVPREVLTRHTLVLGETGSGSRKFRGVNCRDRRPAGR